MTEAEWLACNEPTALAKYGLDRFNLQGFRWLAVDMGRRIRHFFDDEERRVFDAFEAWVSGTGPHLSLLKLPDRLVPIDYPFPRTSSVRAFVSNLETDNPIWAAFCASECLKYPDSPYGPPGENDAGWKANSMLVEREFCSAFRDIVGNPFRPVAFESAWLTSTVLGIAQGIHDDRAFDRLPILADALQDADCENDDILSHCRGDGPHVRGCWVVDGVLGSE